jgi:hypothetical protein
MHISTSHAVESQAPAASQARLAQLTPPTREAERQANPNAEDARPTKSVMPAGDATRLSEADLRQVQELKARDREVRAHEQAHLAAGGSLARGGATYTYERGPDGKRYAVGGEVRLESARVPGDPEATAERAEQVQRAAMAPASPSAQDRAVAAQASALASQARAEARAEAAAEAREESAGTEADASQAIGQGVDALDNSGIQAVPPADGPGSSDAPADVSNASRGSEISLYESVASLQEQPTSANERFQPMTA